MKRLFGYLAFAWLLLILGIGLVAANPPGTYQPLLLSAGGAPSITFQNTYDNTSALTTYNFASVALGTALPNRAVGVCVQGYQANRTISSATIDGITASVVNTITGGSNVTAAFIIANVSNSDTTGTVSVTWSGAQAGTSLGVWAIYNLTSLSAAASNTSTGSPATLNINMTKGDVMTVCGVGNTGTTSGDTGFTSRYNYANSASEAMHGGDFTATITETPRSVSFTWSAATIRAAVSQSFR